MSMRIVSQPKREDNANVKPAAAALGIDLRAGARYLTI